MAAAIPLYTMASNAGDWANGTARDVESVHIAESLLVTVGTRGYSSIPMRSCVCQRREPETGSTQMGNDDHSPAPPGPHI